MSVMDMEFTLAAHPSGSMIVWGLTDDGRRYIRTTVPDDYRSGVFFVTDNCQNGERIAGDPTTLHCHVWPGQWSEAFPILTFERRGKIVPPDKAPVAPPTIGPATCERCGWGPDALRMECRNPNHFAATCIECELCMHGDHGMGGLR